MESLQAQLKQREGELVQVQMELGAMERSKANMAAEVNRLSQKVERLEALETDLERLKTAYAETEQKYQTMLTVRNFGYADVNKYFSHPLIIVDFPPDVRGESRRSRRAEAGPG